MSGRFCALLLVALAWPLPNRAAGQEGGEEPIFAAVRAVVRDGKLERSKVHGFDHSRSAYDDRPVQDGILVGFDVGVGDFAGGDTVYALRPVYRTPRGLVSGEDIGLFADVQDGKRKLKTKVLRTVRLRARPGYAVAGLNVRTGLNIDGLSLTYMRIEGTRLAPRWVETSEWVGDRDGGSPSEIVGDGSPIVGVFGKRDPEQIKSVGVYFARVPKPVDPVQPPKVVDPAEQPKVDQPKDAPKVEKPADAPKEAAPADAPATPPVAAADGIGRFAAPLVIFLAVTGAIVVGVLVMNRREAAQPVAVRPMHTGLSRPGPLAPLGSGDAITADAPSIPTLEPVDSRPKPWDNYNYEPPVTKSADFAKAAKETAVSLFVVAGLQVIGVLLTIGLANKLPGGPLPKEAVPFVVVIGLGLAAVFAGLGVWAWSQPLFAAIVGLVLYVVVFLLDIAGHISSGNAQGATSGLFIKIAIIAGLIRCISISAKANSGDSVEDMLRQHERMQALGRDRYGLGDAKKPGEGWPGSLP